MTPSAQLATSLRRFLPDVARLAAQVFRVNWVNPCFPDGGNRVRFLRLQSADDLAAPAVSALIQRALDVGDVPIPIRTRGRLVVRSAAPRPRPRGRT